MPLHHSDKSVASGTHRIFYSGLSWTSEVNLCEKSGPFFVHEKGRAKMSWKHKKFNLWNSSKQKIGRFSRRNPEFYRRPVPSVPPAMNNSISASFSRSWRSRWSKSRTSRLSWAICSSSARSLSRDILSKDDRLRFALMEVEVKRFIKKIKPCGEREQFVVY